MNIPEYEPKISLGQIAQMVVVVFTAAVLWGSQQQETRELRSWLVRHENSLQDHANLLSKLAATDERSAADREHLREIVRDMKVGQDRILEFIRK